jgi:hypothetical protein
MSPKAARGSVKYLAPIILSLSLFHGTASASAILGAQVTGSMTGPGCVQSSPDGTTPVSCSFSSSAFPGATMAYSSYASTSLFSMHASAGAIVTSDGAYNLSAAASAQSYIFDFLTLSGAPSSGFLQFAFDVDGTVSTTIVVEPGGGYTEGATAPLFLVETNGGTNQVTVISNANSVFSGQFIVDIAYSGLNPTLDLILSTQAHCGVSASTLGASQSCVAVANYSDTVTIAGVGVLDANGNLIPGATVESSSGVFYPTLASAPEPAFTLLLAPILAAILVAKNRTRKDLLK